MERKASAVWKGGLKDGKGEFSAPREYFLMCPIRLKRGLKMRPERTPRN